MQSERVVANELRPRVSFNRDGLVFQEKTIPSLRLRKKQIETIPSKLIMSALHGEDCSRTVPTLETLAIQQIFRSVDYLTPELLEHLPWEPVGKRVWQVATSCGCNTVSFWRIFAAAYPEQGVFSYFRHSQVRLEKAVQDHLRDITSSQSRWLTSLTVALPNLELADIMAISDIQNLVALDVCGLKMGVSNNPSVHLISDQVVGWWGKRVNTHCSFPQLRVLILRNQKDISEKIFQCLDLFPSLVIFGVQGCTIGPEMEPIAARFGWTCVDDSGLLKRIQRDIDHCSTWDGALKRCVELSEELVTSTDAAGSRHTKLPLLNYKIGITTHDLLLSTPLVLFRNLNLSRSTPKITLQSSIPRPPQKEIPARPSTTPVSVSVATPVLDEHSPRIQASGTATPSLESPPLLAPQPSLFSTVPRAMQRSTTTTSATPAAVYHPPSPTPSSSSSSSATLKSGATSLSKRKSLGQPHGNGDEQNDQNLHIASTTFAATLVQRKKNPRHISTETSTAHQYSRTTAGSSLTCIATARDSTLVDFSPASKLNSQMQPGTKLQTATAAGDSASRAQQPANGDGVDADREPANNHHNMILDGSSLDSSGSKKRRKVRDSKLVTLSSGDWDSMFRYDGASHPPSSSKSLTVSSNSHADATGRDQSMTVSSASAPVRPILAAEREVEGSSALQVASDSPKPEHDILPAPTASASGIVPGEGDGSVASKGSHNTLREPGSLIAQDQSKSREQQMNEALSLDERGTKEERLIKAPALQTSITAADAAAAGFGAGLEVGVGLGVGIVKAEELRHHSRSH